MTEDAGYLTTHVLDTARGCPAAGLVVEIWRIAGESRELLRTMHTNADGRTDSPILPKGELARGLYELVFHAGAYLGAAGDAPPFLDIIPIRFGIGDPSQHYHVPLLLAPFAYSTYRGS